MASPKDVIMDEGATDVHKPFTVEENIRQLNEIDKNIVRLMDHTATALNAVSMPTSSTDPSKPVSDSGDQKEAQKEALQTATDSFLNTLHSVDVKMKRQIMALEEAGIINLSSTSGSKQEAGSTTASAASKTSLKPDGMGNLGNLDVGWLNSRGSKVEREMEAELWSKAKDFLENEGDDLKMG